MSSQTTAVKRSVKNGMAFSALILIALMMTFSINFILEEKTEGDPASAVLFVMILILIVCMFSAFVYNRRAD